MTEYKNILVVQLRQLGDILLTTPVVEALRELYPNAKLSFLAHPMGKLVLNGNPSIDECLYYPSSKIEYLKFLKRLRSNKYDIVFDFMFNGRSSIMARMTGADCRVSFASNRSVMYTNLIDRNTGKTQYIVDEKLRLLENFGWSGERKNITLTWFEKDLDASSKFLSNLSKEKIRVVLATTHRRENRRWPLDRYAALSDFLVNVWGAEVIWLWGPGEESYVDDAMKLCKERARKAPRTSFREMAALVAQSDLFIANSNGPSHVAVSCNVPSIQLHGPTNLSSWCPKNEFHRGLWGGSLNSLMEDIPLGDVIELANDMKYLAQRSRSARNSIGAFKSYEDTVKRLIVCN